MLEATAAVAVVGGGGVNRGAGGNLWRPVEGQVCFQIITNEISNSFEGALAVVFQLASAPDTLVLSVE